MATPFLEKFHRLGLDNSPYPAIVDQILDEIRFAQLRRNEAAFPDCIILKEKFLFFTKCFIAVRKSHERIYFRARIADNGSDEEMPHRAVCLQTPGKYFFAQPRAQPRSPRHLRSVHEDLQRDYILYMIA